MEQDWILYEDRQLLVCRKPAGFPVQSSHIGVQDLESALKTYLSQKGEGQELYVIHRLDQPVEGILVFGKTKRSAEGLSRQIRENQMEKTYLAVCCVQEKAKLPDFSGDGFLRLTHVLRKDARTNTSQAVPEGTRGGKRAELLCRKVKESRSGAFLLAEIRLLTGRHHQIRVQTAACGMPLYADRKYNPRWESFAQAAGETPEKAVIGLCAARLSFLHPATRKKMEFSMEPSGRIFQILQRETE